MSPSTITTVMPAYNEGDRLSSFLREWAAEGVRHASVPVTAIVVDDGSRPEEEAQQRRAADAASSALRAAGAPHRVEYVRAERNRGKGAAIRLGWSHADPATEWLGFIDADGAVPASEYWRLADMLAATPADVVCGSRIRMAGRSVTRSLFRHLQGRTFATGVERLFRLGFYDTQCGLKFFRAARLRPLLPSLEEERWLLDIEILVRLVAEGAPCVEVPIDCHERGGSSLVVGVDPLRMAYRLVKLRSRLRARAGGR